MKLTPEERMDIVVGRSPEFQGEGIVTWGKHSSECPRSAGFKLPCCCVIPLTLEYRGFTYEIDAFGNLTSVSTH